MNANYYCFISYKVKIARVGEYRHYRGIFAKNQKGKFYFKVSSTQSLTFEDSLSLSTLRSYKAELLPSKIMAREALNAVLRASKDWNGGRKMTPEDIMRVSVRTQRPKELNDSDKIIYERAEIGYGKVKEC